MKHTLIHVRFYSATCVQVRKDGKVLFQNCTEREAKRQAGKLRNSNVLKNARNRVDGKALRAVDGAVLKVPYVVRLRS